MSQFALPVVGGAALAYTGVKAYQAADRAVEAAAETLVKAPYYGLRSAINYYNSRQQASTMSDSESKKRIRDYLYKAQKRSRTPGMDSLARTQGITYGPMFKAQKSTSKELGFIDGVVNGSVSTVGSVHLLNTIANGTSGSQRVGKKVTLKYIQMRGQVAPLGTMTASCTGAFLIVYDIRPGTTLPTITDILNSASPYAMNNDSNNGRFKILHRDDFTLIGNLSTVAGSSLTSRTIHSLFGFKKLNKKVEYGNAGTGAIGDITLGGLYAVFIGDGVGTGGGSALMNYRIRYQDE